MVLPQIVLGQALTKPLPPEAEAARLLCALPPVATLVGWGVFVARASG